MSDTRALLAKISALRQRLDQAQGLAQEAREAAAALLASQEGPVEEASPAEAGRAGCERGLALDEALAPVTSPADRGERAPRQLTSRARKVLERGRQLLGRLRALAEQLAPPEADGDAAAMLGLYRDTVAMIDTALRTVALLPDSTTGQLHLCRGLEVTLEEVEARLGVLTAGCQDQARAAAQLEALTAALLALSAGGPVDTAAVAALADELLAEAREGSALTFLSADPTDVPRFVACHGLTVARVMARAVRQDAALRGRAAEAVLAALVHDVGMLAVPAEVLAREDVIAEEERRVIEAHALAGAELVRQAWPEWPWLAEAVGAHHERADGTGYPDGLVGGRITPLARLLAVCDVYAALCAARPHRPARSTRTAMADALLLADQGQLDRQAAEALLSLSFYPVGSVVELSQGSVALVVATPAVSADLSGPARPVVALLTDASGEPLPRPRHLDLGLADAHTIVRPLPPSERKELLRRRAGRWAA